MILGRLPGATPRGSVKTPRRWFVRGRAWSVLAVALAASVGCSAPGPTPAELAKDVRPAVEEYMTTVDPDRMVRAVLVQHDGQRIVERYVDSTAADYWDTQSVTKSVVGTLVGIAIAEGHIDSVQQTLGELLPSRAAEMSASTAAVTLEQVLTHTGGFAA